MRSSRFRRTVGALVAVLLLPIALALAPGGVSPAGAQAGGSIVLMGIDAEDGGPGGHGPVVNYEQVVNAILASTTGTGSGIAVIGGGPGTQVNEFWAAISALNGVPVTHFVTIPEIQSVNFRDFAMVAISSGEANTPSGGLNNAQNDALTLRAFDLADMVNAGGGLLGFTQDGLTTEFGYMGDIGDFASAASFYSDIDPTPEGEAIGVTDALDVCCWHNVFTSFPDYMEVLAFEAGTTDAAAIGGFDIAIPTGCELEPLSAEVNVGGSHTVTATAREEGEPLAGADITFEVVSGPNEGEGAVETSDANGQASFTVSSDITGTDEITASFVDSLQRVRPCNIVTVTWVEPVDPVDPVTPVTPAEPIRPAEPAQRVGATPTFTG